MTKLIGRMVVAGGLGLVSLLAAACSSPDASKNGGGTTIPSADLCAAQFDALEKACPTGNPKDESVEICKFDQHDYAAIGCQDEYDAWLQCTAGPGYNCVDDTGCESPQTGYFACQSQAVQRTGCLHLGQDAERCGGDATKPYSFSCLGTAPASCTQVVTGGAGIWCCPQL